jgi:hypothetical protein
VIAPRAALVIDRRGDLTIVELARKRRHLSRKMRPVYGLPRESVQHDRNVFVRIAVVDDSIAGQ